MCHSIRLCSFLAFSILIINASPNDQSGNRIRRCCGAATNSININQFECKKVDIGVTNHLEDHLVTLQEDGIDIKFEEEFGFHECGENEEMKLLQNGEENFEFLINFEQNVTMFNLKDESEIEKFCVDFVSNDYGHVIGSGAVFCGQSVQTECQNRPCVRMCCPIGHSYNWTSNQCQISQDLQ